ncbi:MAG: 16S rRNA (cytidine(1402)-2'-O)-methyltransferase [Gammaproteobacteria bacterium]|nr:16S rRNA (cytidine(1402)-2'-O)-methyltransferase [Gammaproteobacteria bacterium]
MLIKEANYKGILYVVATPIGNLEDMTPRAIEVLKSVDQIAAEDTRHSQPMLKHFGITTHCIAYHDHIERQLSGTLIDQIESGSTIALISDAGTPLISDPGYQLVKLACQRNIKVVPIPGSCAVVAALSASGLPSDRFIFEGYLPAKSGARQKKLHSLSEETRTLIFYESPHRIVEALTDMAEVLGPQRRVAIARELTKLFETIKLDTLENLCEWIRNDKNQQKGEFVVLVHGKAAEKNDTGIDSETDRVLQLLLEELPVKQAASLAAKITGVKKNVLYQYAINRETT